MKFNDKIFLVLTIAHGFLLFLFLWYTLIAQVDPNIFPNMAKLTLVLVGVTVMLEWLFYFKEKPISYEM